MRRSDELGVLSVYVNVDPRADPHSQGAGIDLRNRFRDLQRRIGEGGADGSGDVGDDVTGALERIWPQVESLGSPDVSGRGRLAFFGLGSGWVARLETQLPVTSRVVLDEHPFIHPLLELLDEGRPAGVLVISGDAAEIHEWRLGALTAADRLEPEYVEAPHERTGQIGGGPQGQFHTPMREQRQSRERDRMERFVEQAVDRAAALATDRGWERIVLSAAERWRDQAAHRFPQQLQDKVITDSRLLGGLDDAGVATAVTEVLHDRHKAQEAELSEQTLAAGRVGHGALGLSEVAAALNQGRIEHLVYDPNVRYAASVGTDGALYAGDEAGPGDRTPEPRLTERLVERALAGGARVSPVEGAAEGSLREAEGIGALLRW
jgi:hypothetical protein